jgi:hypothetical protein
VSVLEEAAKGLLIIPVVATAAAAAAAVCAVVAAAAAADGIVDDDDTAAINDVLGGTMRHWCWFSYDANFWTSLYSEIFLGNHLRCLTWSLLHPSILRLCHHCLHHHLPMMDQAVWMHPNEPCHLPMVGSCCSDGPTISTNAAKLRDKLFWDALLRHMS